MSTLPLIPVTMVGSWPRPLEVLAAQKEKQKGRLSVHEFEKVADRSVLNLLRVQERAGLDVVTDGEQRRDNFYSFVAEKLEGIRLMTLSEMLEVVEDKASFERILQTLDVPSYVIRNPTCVGPIRRRDSLAIRELTFLKTNTDKPVKIPLPGPYLLTRAMYVPELTGRVYSGKEALADDVVSILRDEIDELREAGVDFIQFDEPVLTELVFAKGRTRTFMCASLAARGDPGEELAFAVSLINRVTEGVEGVRTGLHVCRGNWSQNEATLLSGSYGPLQDYFHQVNVQQLVLEYATERAGDLIHFKGKEIGLGVINPRTAQVESEEEICARIAEALNIYAPEQLFINPDCGFGTFSARAVNSCEIAEKKIIAMVAAVQRIRSTL